MSSDKFPPSLNILAVEPQYSKLKTLFSDCRKTFKHDPIAQIDLEAYLRRDNSHNYTKLPGLVPEALLGNAAVGGGIPYNRSDSFFTDFCQHHSEECVLSSSNDSLIIGNRASHDIRLYLADWDPCQGDRSSSAGMSYFHFMVIPKKKVYNSVCLDDTSLIEEMISHFKRFWSTPDAAQKSIARIQQAVDSRASEVMKHLQRDPVTPAASARIVEFEETMREVQKSTEELSFKLKVLTTDDFVFGFHPAPHASVGHLHMHALPVSAELRRYSTAIHDWKTVPATAVMEVICEEQVSQSSRDAR